MAVYYRKAQIEAQALSTNTVDHLRLSDLPWKILEWYF